MVNVYHLILEHTSTIEFSDYGNELYKDKCSICIGVSISHQHNANDSMKDKASKPLWATQSKFYRSEAKSASNPSSVHRRVRTCDHHQIKSVDRFERTLDTHWTLDTAHGDTHCSQSNLSSNYIDCCTFNFVSVWMIKYGNNSPCISTFALDSRHDCSASLQLIVNYPLWVARDKCPALTRQNILLI